jgi:phage-related baseplate assembly protein
VTLENLPEIKFCDTDATKVEQSVIAAYEGISGLKLYPGDPVRLFLEGLAMMIAQQREIIDYTGKQNLLAFAEGGYLDHLGALTGTERLGARVASTVLRFTMKTPMATTMEIPKGTRATCDGKVLFAICDQAAITPGNLTVEVKAECMSPGEMGNGYRPGQIIKLVDMLPFECTVSNIAVSANGANKENDDSLRNRIYFSVERYTTAGTVGQYKYWAKTAHPDIADVAVYSIVPGTVEVVPLLEGGQLPTPEILDRVVAVLTPGDVVPLTDTVNVNAPETIAYDLDVNWFVDPGKVSLAGSVQAAVGLAVEDYIAWQGASLGRNINPAELIHRIMGAGASRVDVVSPAHQSVEEWQVPRVGGIKVSYCGVES